MILTSFEIAARQGLPSQLNSHQDAAVSPILIRAAASSKLQFAALVAEVSPRELDSDLARLS